MPGGLMQLVAYGAQDLYLTGHPMMTFFKLIYRRHTNFATEYIRLDFDTLPVFDAELKSRAKVKIPRHGDMIHDCFFVIDLPAIYGQYISGFKWVDYLGFNMIHYLTVTIGSSQIDKHYGQWLTVWNELTLSDAKKRYLYKMVNNSAYPLRTATNANWSPPADTLETKKPLLYPAKRIYVPLSFWFCINPGLALPLIALQYNEVFLNFEFQPFNTWFTLGSNNFSPSTYLNTTIPLSTASEEAYRTALVSNGVNSLNALNFFLTGEQTNVTYPPWTPNPNVEGNFVYLDNDERKLFSKYTQEYLIPQVQRREYLGLKSGPNSIRIKINHPVKEIIWTYRQTSAKQFNDHNNYTYLTTSERYRTSQNFLTFVSSALATNFADYLTGMDNYNSVMNRLFLDVKLNFLTSPVQSITDDFLNILQFGKFRFNGKDRFREKDHIFFSQLEPFRTHSGAPRIPGINTYSFAFNPEKDQPSGTCNFSRIDKFEFLFTLKTNHQFTSDSGPPGLNVPFVYDSSDSHSGSGIAVNNENLYDMHLYATNYNVLRIMGGMGDLAFAN